MAEKVKPFTPAEKAAYLERVKPFTPAERAEYVARVKSSTPGQPVPPRPTSPAVSAKAPHRTNQEVLQAELKKSMKSIVGPSPSKMVAIDSAAKAAAQVRAGKIGIAIGLGLAAAAGVAALFSGSAKAEGAPKAGAGGPSKPSNQDYQSGKGTPAANQAFYMNDRARTHDVLGQGNADTSKSLPMARQDGAPMVKSTAPAAPTPVKAGVLGMDNGTANDGKLMGGTMLALGGSMAAKHGVDVARSVMALAGGGRLGMLAKAAGLIVGGAGSAAGGLALMVQGGAGLWGETKSDSAPKPSGSADIARGAAMRTAADMGTSGQTVGAAPASAGSGQQAAADPHSDGMVDSYTRQQNGHNVFVHSYALPAGRK